MAEIIVEGHKIDTKDIWDIQCICNTREAKIIIRTVGKPNITIGKNIPYETRGGEFHQYWIPIERLYKEVKEKWETDKSEIPIFKL